MMRSTQAATSERISGSVRRTIRQLLARRCSSFARSFGPCLFKLCQYDPSTSTASRDSGNATSSEYGPIAKSGTNFTPRRSSSSLRAYSMLLVLGQFVATHAPVQRREQNRKRETSEGLTSTTHPHISQAIGTLGLKRGCSLPTIPRLTSSTQAFEQYFRPRSISGSVALKVVPQ